MGGSKTAILAQVVHFYFAEAAQYYVGTNTSEPLRCQPPL